MKLVLRFSLTCLFSPFISIHLVTWRALFGFCTRPDSWRAEASSLNSVIFSSLFEPDCGPLHYGLRCGLILFLLNENLLQTVNKQSKDNVNSASARSSLAQVNSQVKASKNRRLWVQCINLNTRQFIISLTGVIEVFSISAIIFKVGLWLFFYQFLIDEWEIDSTEIEDLRLNTHTNHLLKHSGDVHVWCRRS